MDTYVVALDQGTTTSRAILFNKAGNIVARAQYPFHQIYPQPGWVEHDPMEIWATEKKALVDAVDAVVAVPPVPEQPAKRERIIRAASRTETYFFI